MNLEVHELGLFVAPASVPAVGLAGRALLAILMGFAALRRVRRASKLV